MIDPIDDTEMRAGEYVLGVLDAEAAAAIRAELIANTPLAAAVANWESRLAPLARQIEPVAPNHTLWERIDGSLEDLTRPQKADTKPGVAAAPEQRAPSADLARAVQFWRGATVAALALAAGLAGVLWLGPLWSGNAGNSKLYTAAIMPGQGAIPCWLAEAHADGNITVTTLGAQSEPADKDLQLWGVALGELRPVSLGVLPHSGSYVAPDAGLPHNHLLLLVSQEPKGGSPTGLPTGPLLYSGELTVSN